MSLATRKPAVETASQIYLGQVMHQRFFPVAYKFRYGVMSLRINVDRIEEEVKKVKGLSLNRFNLYSLYQKDYGARDGSCWRSWMENLLEVYGVSEKPARIELVCFPRFMGVVFNPLAVWYAYNRNGELMAIVGEVSNTFGQWHHYVLTDTKSSLDDKVQARAEKVFHVSPFINMECEYHFRFTKPGKHYQLGIYQHQNGRPMLVATQAGKSIELNTRNLMKAAIRLPFNTLKVLILIHWWALKIWLKGGKFHKTPHNLAKVKYSHTEMTQC